MTADDRDDDSARSDIRLTEFLERFVDDRAAGRRRSLDDYLVEFPGPAEPLAAEYFAAERAAGAGDAFPYEIVREVGRGGQGVVYEAVDTRLRRRVALKLLHGAGGLASTAARLRREAAIAARFDDPGLCAVYDIGERDGVAYAAMRFVEGDTLADLIRRRNEGPRLRDATEIERAARLVEKLGRIVHRVHEGGVVHRDLKPSNVVVGPDGEPTLLDFGLAGCDDAQEALTRTGDVLGTPAYLAPEQCASAAAPPDRRSDVWSLGVLLYEALSGVRPFTGPSREAVVSAIVGAEPRRLSQLQPAIGSGLERVVAAALEKEPSRRYPTAGAFADDLARVLQGSTPRAKGPGLARRLRAAVRRRPYFYVALLIASAIGTLGAQRLLRREAVDRAVGDGRALVAFVAAARDGRAPDADLERRLRDRLGPETLAYLRANPTEAAALDASFARIADAHRGDGGLSLLSPRGRVAESRPRFRFRSYAGDGYVHVVVVRDAANGEIVATLEAGADPSLVDAYVATVQEPLPATRSGYAWTVRPRPRTSLTPSWPSDPGEATFVVATSDEAAALMSRPRTGETEDDAALLSAYALLAHGFAERALGMLDGIDSDRSTDADFARAVGVARVQAFLLLGRVDEARSARAAHGL
jgi:hypothetical protein